MKLLRMENTGVHQVFNTNVKDLHNYVAHTCVNHNCVVDEDYQGELHISLVNTSNYIVEICENEKITQWLEVHVDYSELAELTEETLFTEETERGAGGFGSTDKK